MSQYFNVPQAPAAPVARGPQRSGLAVASLVTGLLSLPLFFCLGIPLAVLSLIFGIVALVMISKSPATRKGKGLALTGIICSTISLAGTVGLTIWARNNPDTGESPRRSVPKTALEEAEDNIRIKRNEQIAFGNSPEAEELAARMSEQFKTLRETLFTESTSRLSLSDGEFLTHCELHENSCAFLIHVPSLRKFDDDAKKSLSDLAWLLAQSVLGTTEFPEGGRLAVGVKGLLLYDDIRTGKHVKDREGNEDQATGMEASNETESVLKAFFPELTDGNATVAEPNGNQPANSSSEKPEETTPPTPASPQPQ